MPQPFTIYVMQFAHTDIGYTFPQEQVGWMYLDIYDTVLALCAATANSPAAERFKWTCETAWQVQHYLAARPEREEEFLKYVRAGQIEITAAYLHFTDLIDADAYRRSLRWVVDYCARHHLPLKCALHSDINGWPWALADILHEANIPYFCSHVHLDSATDPLGKRGSVHYGWMREWAKDYIRPDAPVRIPQAFHWQGPQGGRVLHWLNEHYQLGNILSISSNTTYGSDKTRYFTESDRATVEDLYARAREEAPLYVERLRADGYPYDALLLGTGGFYVDNAPPDTRWLEVIARWNREHDEIQLRSATLGEWFAYLDAHTQRDALPTYAVAWPDGWAHGLGSATARIAQARRTQRRRAAALALVETAGSPEAATLLDGALQQERLALEHTFDAWSTTYRPSAPMNDFQRIVKELTFHRAELLLDEAVGTALRTRYPAEVAPRLFAPPVADAATTLSRTLHFDAGDQDVQATNQQLVAADGTTHAVQIEHAELRQYVAVVPLTPGRPSAFHLAQVAAQTFAEDGEPYLETDAWRLSIDPATGGLRSLRHQPTMREWVDATHAQTFGQMAHEAVVHPLGRAAVGNYYRLLALGTATEVIREAIGDHEIVRQAPLRTDGQVARRAGPVFDAVTLQGAAAELGRVRIMWRVYHATPLVEVVYEWEKAWSDLPEAVYIAFPFAQPAGTLQLETAGGFFQPGSHAPGGQLPGTCSRYYTVQRAARIAQPGATLLWLPVDAPLVMTNALNFNDWETEPWTWNGFLASMPVNHYWHTNFPTSQRGPMRLRYRFIMPTDPSQEVDALAAAQPVDAFGWR